MDYILGMYRCLLQNLVVRDTRQKTDHYLVLGFLCGVTLREHQCYLRSCTWLPLYPPKQPSHKDSLFASLRQAVLKTPAREHVHASCILEDT